MIDDVCKDLKELYKRKIEFEVEFEKNLYIKIKILSKVDKNIAIFLFNLGFEYDTYYGFEKYYFL